MKVRPDDSSKPSTYSSVPTPEATQTVSSVRLIWLIVGTIELLMGMVVMIIATSPSYMNRYGYEDVLPIILSAIGVLLGMGIGNVLIAYYLPRGRRRIWQIAVVISLLHIAVGVVTIFTLIEGWFASVGPTNSIKVISILAYTAVGAVLLVLLCKTHVRENVEIHYGSRKKVMTSACMIIAVVVIPTFTIFYSYGYSTGIFALQASDYADRDRFESPYSWYIPQGINEWSTAADMPTPRDEPAAGVIENQIYVVGGHVASTFATDKVEVYDTKRNVWSEVRELPMPLDHVGTASYQRKLYVVGGLTGDFGPSNTLFIYDPLTNDWARGKDMPTARGSVTAQFVNGILYVVGGWNGEPLRANEAYDPETDTWVSKAPMPTARDHVASSVVDGKLYVIGGRQGSLWTNVNVNEAYDPKKDEWSTKAPIPSYRAGITAASLSDSIYVFGGENPVRTFDNTEQYIPSLDRWVIRDNMPTARHGSASAVVDGNIYLIGGSATTGFSITDRTEVFKPTDWKVVMENLGP